MHAPSHLRPACCLALLWLAASCVGPDPSLLRKRPDRDADAGIDAGPGPANIDGGTPGKPPTPIDRGSVDGPTESIDCTSSGEFTVCTRPHAESTCIDDECLIIACLGDWLDCDGESDNGCETTLQTVEHCGRCGARCALSNVEEHLCDEVDGAARCGIDHHCTEEGCMEEAPELGCKDGFGDCDGDPSNGCETALEGMANCGACGLDCRVPSTVVACEERRCVTVGCSPGFGNCDGEGCAPLASDAMNCGSCGNACPAEADMCSGGRCTGLVCDDGVADCNGEVGDLCEADLSSTAHCGVCDNACPSAPHAAATCEDGQCGFDCDPGFADCDENADNGCEVDLNDGASCGACGNDCSAAPHVEAASCNDGVCSDLVCEDGWDDCNGDPKDGCEQPLNTLEDCGSCGRACSVANGEATCNSGSCQISGCEQGWEDCNEDAEDGCEANLGIEPNCGGCGIVCGTGSTCSGGGCSCVDSSGCEVGECCNGVCIDTSSTCTFWLCIPGTNRDYNNCGGCGIPCIPFVHWGCCAVF